MVFNDNFVALITFKLNGNIYNPITNKLTRKREHTDLVRPGILAVYLFNLFWKKQPVKEQSLVWFYQ